MKVYEGLDEVASKNSRLGTFSISGLTSAPAGDVEVSVEMVVDQSSILTATARETETGIQATIRIDKKAKLTGAQVDAMQREEEKASGSGVASGKGLGLASSKKHKQI